MKRKRIYVWMLAGSLSVGSILPVYGAEFTDDPNTNVTNESEISLIQEESPDIFSDGAQEADTFSDSIFENNGVLGASEADEGTEGLVYEYVEETDSYRVIKGVDTKNVIIPAAYEGKPVMEIASGAFVNCSSMESVSVRKMGCTIRTGAFVNCSALRGIGVAGGIGIESQAFRECPKLYQMSGVNCEEQAPYVIAPDAFDADCKIIIWTIGSIDVKGESFVYIDLESGVHDYRVNGVEYVDMLLNINGQTKDGMVITDFDNSRQIVDSSNIDLGYSIVAIYRKAFYGSDRLEELTLSPGIQYIQTKAFAYCTNLRELRLPDTVVDIAEDAFEGCDNLTIFCTAGSYVEEYCRTHKIPFIAEGAEPSRLVQTGFRVSNQSLYFDIGFQHAEEGAAGYEFQSLASDGKTILLTKTSDSSSTVLRKAPNDIYVRGRYWKQVNGHKVYSAWSDMIYLHADIKVGNISLEKAEIKGNNVTLTFADNPNFFKESDGYDCMLKNADNQGESYMLKNRMYRTIRYKNIEKGTYYVIAKAYKIVNGKKYYGKASDTQKIVVK